MHFLKRKGREIQKLSEFQRRASFIKCVKQRKTKNLILLTEFVRFSWKHLNGFEYAEE